MPGTRRNYVPTSVQCALIGEPLRWLLWNNEAVRTGKATTNDEPKRSRKKKAKVKNDVLVRLEKSNEELRRNEAYKLKYG